MQARLSRGVWWWTVAAFLAAATGAIFVSNNVRGNARKAAEWSLDSAASTMQARVQAELDRQTKALTQIAGKGNSPSWEADARGALAQNPSLLAIAWIANDPAQPLPAAEDGLRFWQISTAQPPIYVPSLKRLHGIVQATRGKLLTEALAKRQLKVTDAIHLADRGKAFAAYAPSAVDGKVQGAVMGVFHLQILMDSIFEKILAQDHSLQVLDGYQPIYERGEAKAAGDNWERAGEIQIFGSAWRTRMWPNPALAIASEKEARKTLWGGLGASALLAGLVFYLGRKKAALPPPQPLKLNGAAAKVEPPVDDRLRAWEMAIANVDEALFIAEAEKIIGGGCTILYANEALACLTGRTAQELMGRSLKNLLPLEGSQDFVEQIRIGVKRQKTFRLVLPLQQKGIEPLEAHLRMKPVFDGANNVTHWTGFVKGLGGAQESASLSKSMDAPLDAWPMAASVTNEYGVVLEWNRKAAELTGLAAASVVGKESPLAAVPFNATTERGPARASLDRADGSKLEFLIWSAALDAAGRKLTWLADVTGQAAMGTSRETEFRALAENATEILAILAADSTVEYANTPAREALQLKPGEALPAELIEKLEQSEPLGVMKSLDAKIEVRGRDGVLREIDSVLTLVEGSKLMVLNASTRQKAKPEEDTSPAWFLNAVQDAIMTFDAEHRVVWMNRAAEDLYGFSTGFAKGKSTAELIPDWLQVPGRDHIRESLDADGFWRGEISNYTPAGREIVQDASITATYDAEKKRNGSVAIYRDITEKKQAVETFSAGETAKALNAIGSSDGLWDWNLRTDEVYFSPRWKEMLGYGEDDIAGELGEWQMLVHDADLPNLKNKIQQHLKGQAEHLEAEYRIRTKSGEFRWMMTRAMAARNASGEALRLVGLQTDIHEQKDSEEQLLFEAFHDSLTGLANRALFLDRVNGMLAMGGREFSVAFLDLASFGEINEALGARGGDKALAEAARRISECVPSGGFLARHGSDEFVAVLPATLEGAQRAFSEQIQYRLGKPYFFAGKTVRFQANLGFAESGAERFASGEEMLQAASRALAGQKAGVAMEAVAPSDAGDELLAGLKRDEFRVFYHPIITLETGEIAGVEALIRWQHPQRGLLTPKDFLPAAESSGKILDLDRWVLREACAKAIDLNERFRRVEPLVLTVNLSSVHFGNTELTAKLEEILASSDINPRYLRIEMNERTLHAAESAHTIAANLGRLRVQLSLDDYSESADALREFDQLPVDRVKLDSSLIRGLSTGRNLEKVRAIITAAESQNMQVVAEGVETLEQLAVLRELKCHLAQGFYFTLPASAGDTEKLLARSPRW